METQCTNSNQEEAIVEEAKKRCETASNQIKSLPLTKLTDSCKQTLLRLINSELQYLTHLTSPPSSTSFNIGYIESILHILQQPSISKTSRVCKPSNGVYIDIVCTFIKSPVWFIVSDRNPKYITWLECGKSKGFRSRLEKVLKAAKASLMLKPAFVILFFANGVSNVVDRKLKDEFGAFEVSDEFEGECHINAKTFRIEVEKEEGFHPIVGEMKVKDEFDQQKRDVLGEKFCSLILSMRRDLRFDVEKGENLLNFDTTALIALVSGISNGGTERLLATPESDLRKRFKINYEFVIAQVMSELQNPILEELNCVVSGKIGMICESVHLEFKELVSMCGGPKEKLRADQVLKCLLIVPDNPSARMMDIQTTRKIALKNKIVFGTGDKWSAPTLTANMGFVRAISQTGMSLLTFEHRPRALTGD